MNEGCGWELYVSQNSSGECESYWIRGITINRVTEDPMIILWSIQKFPV